MAGAGLSGQCGVEGKGQVELAANSDQVPAVKREYAVRSDRSLSYLRTRLGGNAQIRRVIQFAQRERR
jgi:hypothetical protein